MIDVCIVIIGIALPALIAFLVGRSMGTKFGYQVSKEEPISVFEQQFLKEGMIIINNFLELQFLKYTHNMLVGIANKNKFPIKGFLDTSLSENDMDKKLVGFLANIEMNMSQDLRKLFFRYYNKIDPDGKPSKVFETYISEWFIIRLRKINAEYVTSIGDDMSEQNLLNVNSRMFINIELDLYEKMGLISKSEMEKPKTTINKNVLN